MRKRKLEGRRGVTFWVAPPLVKSALFATTTHAWIDAEKIPAEGGAIVVANHVTKIDPLSISHLLYDYGRKPRFLAKDALWKVPGLRVLMRDSGQIPVHRMTEGAVSALASAIEAVREGQLVVVYPEGSITRDPDLWPMRGKSGAARIALETGAPVIPLGHWGEQELLPPYARKPDVFPRKRLSAKVGDPVPLDDLRARGTTPETVAEATERIMTALTRVVADLRGEEPPTERFDPRAAGVDEIGNPKKKKRAKGNG